MSRGFSLIELLVVLTIMTAATLAIASTLPAFRDASAIEAGAEEVATILRKARMLAITRATTVIVLVDKNTRRYWIDGDRKLHTVPASLEVTSHAQGPIETIHFYPDGTADDPALALSSSRKRIAIAISPLTGHVVLRQ